MGLISRTPHHLSIPFLALALAGASHAQGIPPEAGPPRVNRTAAQATVENDARRLGVDMATKLAEKPRDAGKVFPFRLIGTDVIPPDQSGRPRHDPKEGTRSLIVTMVYPEESRTANARERIGSGDGQLIFQHVTLRGEGSAAKALNYATRVSVAELRRDAQFATGGLVVKGCRIGVFADGTRFLAHQAQEARSIAMNQVRQFAHMSFRHSGGENEDFQLEVFVMGPGEVVVTLPRDMDGEELLAAGFDKGLLDELLAKGKKVPGQGQQVSWILASDERKGQIEDDLRRNRTRDALQNAQTREQGGPAEGATQRLDPLQNQ